MAAPRLNPSIIYCPISRYINRWQTARQNSGRDKLTCVELGWLTKRFYSLRVCHMRFVSGERPRGSSRLDSARIRSGFRGVTTARLKVQELIEAVKQRGGKNGNYCCASGPISHCVAVDEVSNKWRTPQL